jgi:hypothetical protein
VEWHCGPPSLGQAPKTTRCDAGTIAVKITRASSGDDFVTECIGPA